MTWIKLDVGFFEDSKVLAVSPGARLLFIASLLHAKHQMSDGLIPASTLGLLHYRTGSTDLAIEELVRAGLWEHDVDGYRIPSFLKWNLPKSELDQRAAKRAERQRRWREGKTNATDSRRDRDASRDALPTRPERETETEREKTTSSSPPALMEHDSPGFDAWYQHYPRKVGKGQARKTWAKLSPAHRAAAVEAVPQFAAVVHRAVELATTADRKADVISGCPHPSTWLNDERWSSDLVAEVAYYGRLCGQQLEALSQTGRTKSEGIREAMGWTQPGEEI